MIEFISNFYLKSKNDDHCVKLPNETLHYTINCDTIEEKIKTIIESYKNMRTIVIHYEDNLDIKYFLSLFTRNYCNIKSRGQFEDILLMNRCIFV